MRHQPVWLLAILLLSASFISPSVTNAQNADTFRPFEEKKGLPVLYWKRASLKQDEQIGQAIWYMAAPNYRYNTYTFPQRVGGGMDFWTFLRSDQRYEERYSGGELGGQPGEIKLPKDKTRLGRWSKWGLINDPDCCTPGQDCKSRLDARSTKFSESFAKDGYAASVTLEDTYGLDYCIGDKPMLEALKKAAGLDRLARPKSHEDWRKLGWTEPACEAPYNECWLSFGQPAGAVGFRKFPNPRFDAEKWKKLNGGRLDSWAGWQENIGDDSLEPPFLIGASCASCHVSHNPLNPPAEADMPKWANLRGVLGSQYVKTSELHSSALPEGSPLKVLFQSRPGMTDTSAVPHDMVHNAGTMIPVMNWDVKPFFPNEKYVDPLTGKTEYGTHRILKSGGDSVNAYNAVLRVYVNIGTCAEECWLNNLMDLTVLDPTQRNFLQTGLDVSQCYEQCPSYKALASGHGKEGEADPYYMAKKIASFLVTRRPTDLMDATFADDAGNVYRGKQEAPSKAKREAFNKFLEEELYLDGKKVFQKGDIDLGRQIFAGLKKREQAFCAECHSSRYPKAEGVSPADHEFADPNLFWEEFSKEDIAAGTVGSEFGLKATAGVRKDWLGNDLLTPVARLGVNRCRSLHSNHMDNHVVDGENNKDAKHIWAEYASDDYHTDGAFPARADQTEQIAATSDGTLIDKADGGRGYMRNVSLLSAWAFAPFLHNNSVGPELCGAPGNPEDMYINAYDVDAAGMVTKFDGTKESYYEADGQTVKAKFQCQQYDPSVRGRIKLALESFDSLLNPKNRYKKITRTAHDITIEAGPRVFKGDWDLNNPEDVAELKQSATYRFLDGAFVIRRILSDEAKLRIASEIKPRLRRLEVVIPAGMQASLVGNLDAKRLASDLMAMMKDGLNPLAGKVGASALELVHASFNDGKFGTVTLDGGQQTYELLRAYNNCTDDVENKGHEFGSELTDAEKRALKAFLLTL